MHGIGNDYVYIDCFKQSLEGVDISDLAVKMSRRHFSVGSDGVILICPSKIANVKMRMFNADGSEGKMCGNGVRCVAKYAVDNGYSNGNSVTVETLSGIKTVTVRKDERGETLALVDMGKAVLELRLIPSTATSNPTVLSCFGKNYEFTLVSMGNPHAVTFVPSIIDVDFAKIGSELENNEIFPEGANIEFVVPREEGNLYMYVWERGSGVTYACGTGACATAVAAIKKGCARLNEPIYVTLSGGTLIITVKEDMTVFMEGAAKTVYEGVYFYEN